MEKPTNNQYPINELLEQRWSSLAFADRMVSSEVLLSLLEAARWSPSCFNAQPWSFIVATKENSAEYERLFSCLVEGNKPWASLAPVLMISVAQLSFDKNNLKWDNPLKKVREAFSFFTEVLDSAVLDLSSLL